LAREGCRVSEALGLGWSNLGLARGGVRLDKNKTGPLRLGAVRWRGVGAIGLQMRAQRTRFEPRADPLSMAAVVRARLWNAHVRRPELDTATADPVALRVHGFRASFIASALANGRSESWVSDRTGHRSSQMSGKYKRAARIAEELEVGDWTPLDEALGLADSEAEDAAAGTERSRLSDLNRRPVLYESTALPLS